MKFIYSTEGKCWQTGQSQLLDCCDTLSFGQKGQTMLGFGGCFNELGMIALNKLSEADRAEVFDELFCEENCGFNYCRLPMGANDFAEIWYSHNETENDFEMENFSIARDYKYLIPYIREAQKRRGDLQLFASPWSPPTWLKFPKVYNYGTLVWEEKYLKAYAKYIRLFLEAYRQENIPIQAYHIQNEPVADQKFPSCLWTGEQYRDFIENYLAVEFTEHSVDSEIWVGTINCEHYNQFLGHIMESEACRNIVKGVAYQWAGKQAVYAAHLDFPDLPIIQSESECGDGSNSWEYAMYIFTLMKKYIANGASSYVYWNMALPEGGESTWGWHQNSLVSVVNDKAVFNPEFYLMKHLSKFVKRGARYISVTGQWGANTMAFENPDGSRVVVMMNPHNKVKRVKILEHCVELQPRSFNTIVV